MLIFALVLWAIHEISFLGTWAFWGLAHKRAWFGAYAIDGGQAPPSDLYRRGVLEVLGSHLLFPAMMVLVYIPWTARGGSMEGLPLWWEVPVHLIIFLLVNETLFYWSHRVLHHKKLFRLIHRKHHEWRHVRGVSAEHAHVFETLCNFVAMWAAPVLLGSHFLIIEVWVFIRIIETVHAHSGFRVDMVSSRHSFHHLHPTKGCLGSFWGPWDQIMGTDAAWKEWKKEQQAELLNQDHKGASLR